MPHRAACPLLLQVSRHDNPYDAAKALVAQAYKLWLQKETRTDDITAIVLFLDWEQQEQQQQQQQAQRQGLSQHLQQLMRVPSAKHSSSSSGTVSISASAS